jgi:hypothetical protein
MKSSARGSRVAASADGRGPGVPGGRAAAVGNDADHRPGPGPSKNLAQSRGRRPVVIDLDAIIVIAHSEMEQAAPTWKKTLGFHPMTAWADHGQDGNGEPLAIVLRPGNAGSETAADHIEAARLAQVQLPRHPRLPGLADREAAAAALLGRHDVHRRGAGSDLEGPVKVMDAGLRRRRAGQGRRVGRGHHRPAWPFRLAFGMRVIVRKNAPTRALSCGSPSSTGTGSARLPPTRRNASSRTSSSRTVGGPSARTGSVAGRTAACGTSRSRTSPRTSCNARLSPWPASCWPGRRCSP